MACIEPGRNLAAGLVYNLWDRSGYSFFMLRVLKILAEIAAAIVGVTLVLALLLIWRLSARPVTSDFMTPYIESGIESFVPDSRVSVAKTLLVWDNVDKSITMHADNVAVRNERGDDIAVIPSLHARISAIGLLFGQFMPTALTIDHPQIRLERGPDGRFVFGGLRMGGEGQAQSAADSFDAVKAGLDKLASTLYMRRLSVINAVFDVRDSATSKDWSVGIPEISIRRTGLRQVDNHVEFGALEGKIAVEVTQKETVATLDVAYVYDPRTREHEFSTTVADMVPAFLAGGHPETLGLGVAAALDLPISGKISVGLDRDLKVKAASVALHGEQGRLVYAPFWDAPLTVKSIDINALFDGKKNVLSVKNTRVDLNGPKLDLVVDGEKSAAAGKDMDLVAQLRVENVPTNRFGDICPKTVLANPREWMMLNLRNGMFTRAEAKFKGAIAWADPAGFSLDEGGGKISLSNVRVTYLDGMPAVEGVNGDATFDLNKMAVNVNSGNIGNLKIRPFTVTMSGLSDVDQFIEIPLQVSGPVPEIMKLIDNKPLGYAKALGLSPDDIQGRADVMVRLYFPLLKDLLMKDVDIKAEGTAAAVASTKLVPGIDIEGGEFSMNLTTASFGLKGKANLNKVPMQIVWDESLDSTAPRPLRRATVTGTLRDDQWGQLGIKFLHSPKGASNLTFEMLKPDKKKIQYSGTVDMSGAEIAAPTIGWHKPQGMTANLKFAAGGRIGGDIDVTSLDLRGEKLKVVGTGKMSSDLSRLLSLNLSSFVMGRSNAVVRLSQNAKTYNLEVAGASLDISGIESDDSGPDLRAKKYKIQVDRLYTSEKGFMETVRGAAVRDAQGWGEIDLQGVADGKVPVSVRLTPQPDGTRSFAVQSGDFGAAMKGFGFTDTITGGKLLISGHSAPETPRQIDGNIKISSFTVEHLPLLALLINATSPFGLTGILTDSADFSRLEGSFRWTGDNLTLTKMHAAGSAMGINCDGKIDLASNEANLQGTLVPFSVVNKILNYIPLIGDLITGGEDQGVLAVAYKIDGPLSDLHVSVNPISLLTPGFIRNLFFNDSSLQE